MTRRARLDRLRAAVAAASAMAAPVKEIWLPAKDGGGGEGPGRYPLPGGRAVLVIYGPDDPDPPEAPG